MSVMSDIMNLPPYVPNFLTVVSEKDGLAMILVYDKNKLDPIKKIPLPGINAKRVYSIYLSDVIAYLQDGILFILDLELGTLEKFVDKNAENFYVYNNYIAIETVEEGFRIYNRKTRKFIVKIENDNSQEILDIFVIKDKVYIRNFDIEILVFDIHKGQYIKKIRAHDVIKTKGWYVSSKKIYDIETDKLIYDISDIDVAGDYDYTDKGIVVFNDDSTIFIDYVTKEKKIDNFQAEIEDWNTSYDSSNPDNFILTDKVGRQYAHYNLGTKRSSKLTIKGTYIKDVESIPNKIIKLLPTIHVMAKNVYRSHPTVFPNIVLANIIENLLKENNIRYNNKIVHFLVEYGMNNYNYSVDEFKAKIVGLLS